MPRSFPRSTLLASGLVAGALTAGALTTLTTGALTTAAAAATSGVPFGSLNSIRSGATGVRVTGWAIDPDTHAAVPVTITADGHAIGTVTARTARPDVARDYGKLGGKHGFAATFALPAGAHRVCVVARNRGRDDRDSTGPDKNLGCRTVTVVTKPAAKAKAAVVPTKTVVTAKAAVVPTKTAAAAAATPALISTSRYIRDIHGVSSDTTTTRAMGAADGAANPSNHRYLALLQIGGQSTSGVVLTATSTYVSYARTVTAMKAYLDGYASKQHSNAPATIAFGTNNDMDVRATTGAIWAQQVVNPLVSYAKRYRHLTVAGANDIEPGFRATIGASEAWVRGYLAATSATFVFNGSADGCGATAAHTACNNGWRANSIAWMAGGYSPTRTLALPQIYNTTMAKQWRYLSITAIENGRKKINFAGPLTEYTACVLQHGGCGSLTNNTAWTALWDQLQVDARARQSTLPYGTDLRIN